jgi:hypothetical protein
LAGVGSGAAVAAGVAGAGSGAAVTAGLAGAGSGAAVAAGVAGVGAGAEVLDDAAPATSAAPAADVAAVPASGVAALAAVAIEATMRSARRVVRSARSRTRQGAPVAEDFVRPLLHALPEIGKVADPPVAVGHVPQEGSPRGGGKASAIAQDSSFGGGGRRSADRASLASQARSRSASPGPAGTDRGARGGSMSDRPAPLGGRRGWLRGGA